MLLIHDVRVANQKYNNHKECQDECLYFQVTRCFLLSTYHWREHLIKCNQNRVQLVSYSNALFSLYVKGILYEAKVNDWITLNGWTNDTMSEKKSDHFVMQRFNRFTCIFSFNKLANELTLVIEFWWLIVLWFSISFAIIFLSLSRSAGNGAIDKRRFVRKNDLFKGKEMKWEQN